MTDAFLFWAVWSGLLALSLVHAVRSIRHWGDVAYWEARLAGAQVLRFLGDSFAQAMVQGSFAGTLAFLVLLALLGIAQMGSGSL